MSQCVEDGLLEVARDKDGKIIPARKVEWVSDIDYTTLDYRHFAKDKIGREVTIPEGVFIKHG
jgi:hypothetical protein